MNDLPVGAEAKVAGNERSNCFTIYRFPFDWIKTTGNLMQIAHRLHASTDTEKGFCRICGHRAKSARGADCSKIAEFPHRMDG
ncbi:hypothetical protein K239x_13410 [Planctomycetes bacterium K23_9]|uniref:Uncharacterized protein n=1 Tax=Stieleria marina TaxID=1930275 RepID=A0A517NQK6_9BACT|nr:hypothetical protein K239x_13410 [Planctomycetes bacterium K23_9]